MKIDWNNLPVRNLPSHLATRVRLWSDKERAVATAAVDLVEAIADYGLHFDRITDLALRIAAAFTGSIGGKKQIADIISDALVVRKLVKASDQG